MEDVYKKIREEKGLPHVGRAVKSKKYGTVWKMIEEKEMWIALGRVPGRKPGESHLIPAVYLKYWKPEPGLAVGKGKTMEYAYSLYDNSFQKHWEILPSPVILDALEERKKA